MNEAIHCLTPKCGSVRWRRGLCMPCYSRIQRLVKKGLVTWEALERKGESLPRLRNPDWGFDPTFRSGS